MTKRIHKNYNNAAFRKSWLLPGVLVGLMLPGMGQAAVFTVTDGSDSYDVNPGNGYCADATGHCTLRAAIQEANATSVSDTIYLQTDVFLNRSGSFEDLGKDGDLDITNDLRIEGSGGVRTVSANSIDRVFHIRNGSSVTLRYLKITGGFLNITPGVPSNAIPGGGGILVEGSSTLSLENSNLTYNSLTGSSSYTLTGGGLYVASQATVYIKNSEITHNSGPGGGGLTNLGHTDILDTTISDNSGGSSNGGGVRNMGGYLNVGNVIISNNSANQGAGIANSDLGMNPGNAVISNSEIKLNQATQYGGGIYNESPLTLTNSTISNNSSGYDGGGIYNTALGDIDIINSTLSSNSGRSGGGIYNTREITLTNVTIYNNSATGVGGGVGGNQIAIYDAGSSFAALTLANTIIANGSSSNVAATTCAGSSGYTNFIHSSGGNLENSNSCGLITTLHTPDIINTNPGLDPELKSDSSHTGTTPVHALLNSSSAIDNANGSLCPQVDQRFLARTDGRCDIGAYEFGAIISQQTNMVDLKLTISDNIDPVEPNDTLMPLTYKVMLTNLYVNASAGGVNLEIQLPTQFIFLGLTTTSTTTQPSCNSEPNAQNIISCSMDSLPGLGRVEVFVTGYTTTEGTITAEAGVTSSTTDLLLGNNSVTEETVSDCNAGSSFNFGGSGVGLTVTPVSGLMTNELGATATFTVALDIAPTADVTIALSSDNTAEGMVTPATLTFTASDWNIPKTVTVTGVGDDVSDGDMLYHVVTGAAMSGDANYSCKVVSDVAVTNLDKALLPALSVAASTASTNENSGDSALFTISRTGSTAAPLTVNYLIGGSAVGGDDYDAVGASVIIPAGSTSVQVQILPKDDGVQEGDESVTLTLLSDVSYIVATTDTVAVTIVDDEQLAADNVDVKASQSDSGGGGVMRPDWLLMLMVLYGFWGRWGRGRRCS
jgi:hypothetical protein